MAFTPNIFLSNNSTTTLRDYQHAARVFTDDQFRLAPKHKFLFHVAFGINQSALRTIELAQRHRNEINMLVKNCDLPNFGITVETLNQYNRKKNVQLTHKYNPISITFHDDNMGLINTLWQNYYSYYYADPTSAYNPGAYNRNATRSSDYINNLYGLDNGSTEPFFSYIKIYQMARHEYISYTLHNPIISSWNHNKVDYSAQGTHDNTMQVMYEAVSYDGGDVQEGTPEGFGLEHYDKAPSPLKGSPDSGSINQTLNNVTPEQARSFASTVQEQINTYQNTKEKQSSGLLSDLTTTQPTTNPLGVVFSSGTKTEADVTVAKLRTL